MNVYYADKFDLVKMCYHILNGTYNEKELEKIKKNIETEYADNFYKDKLFRNSQLCEINLGLAKGLDVSVYANEKYTALQMEQIRLGLLEGLDVTSYLDEKLSANDMLAIRYDLKEGK